MKFFFVFSAVYFSYVMGCVANPVETMNELLSYSGWLELAVADDSLDIIDRRQETGQPDRQWTWDIFTATQVTVENVTEKIRLTHQFLSCSYARVLIELSDLERGIGPECRSMDMTFDCLEDYVQTIKYKNPVVCRMIGALSSLQDLSPTQTQFQKNVFDVLLDMRDYYQQITVVRPAGYDDPATKKFADQECIAVEKHAHLMSKRLFAFYNRFCWPISRYVRVLKCSRATRFVNMLYDYRVLHADTLVINQIKDFLQVIITKFLESHDNTSGFEYDPERNTTRIITYDPEIAVRVVKLNQLLTNDIWKSLDISTRERGSPYGMRVKYLLEKYANGQGGTAIVTPENVYNKLKLAHLFLSCKYAYILKKCCGHTASMWTNCQESQDSVCLDKFLQILNENDPSVMRMIDALAYFQKISPNTTYNRGVYESLKRFKNFYDERTAFPRNTRNVQSWSPAIEKDISEITQTAEEFHSKFCIPSDKFYDSYVGDNVTIDDKGASFIQDVDKDTSLFAEFDYDNN